MFLVKLALPLTLGKEISVRIYRTYGGFNVGRGIGY